MDETVLGIVDFPSVRRGYAPDSVRAFVSAAHAELRRLTDDNARLRARIERLQQEAEVAAQALDEAKRGGASASLSAGLPPPRSATPVYPARAAAADWNQVADDLVRGARAESEAIVAAARREASSIVERANAEAAAVLDRANTDALALRREAHEATNVVGSTARAELAHVERQRAAIAASLTALQQALAHAVDSMGQQPVGEHSPDRPLGPHPYA